jgi:hypothetical protein
MGNDYIAGYPPVCATSDRGDGKMRITWPAWALDRVLQAALTTSHYVANVSLGTPESAAILATGGTEAAGFYIDVDLTYSGSTWLNTHRFSPQRQSTVYYYTSFNLARAAIVSAANNGDTCILWDRDTLGSMLNNGSVGATNKVFSCWGGRANQQISLGNSATSYFWYAGDDLSGTAAVTWQNLTMVGERYVSAAFYWKATGGTAGGGITFSRMMYSGGAGGFFGDYSTVTLAVTFVFSECVLTDFAMGGGSSGITFGNNTGAASTVSHCTIGRTNTGIANASKSVTYTNNLVFDCAGSCYATKTNGTYTKCAATDATGSEAGLNSLTRAQLAFYNENDNGFFDAGYGIRTSSVLWHAGADTTDATDIKGNARHATTPSIGAYEGTVNAFGVTWPTGAQSSVNFTNFAGAVTGTEVAEAHTGNQVVSTAGGNWNIANLGVGNVRPVAFGLGLTGDLSNLVATDAAYATLEGTRNTVVTPLSAVPSPANGGPAAWTQLGASKVGTGDKIYSAADEASRNTVVTPLSAVPSPANGGPAAWLQLNVSRVGTGDKIYSAADEATRNVDPGIAHVEDGTGYKIHNNALVGEFAGGGPVTYPNAPDITVARLTDTSMRVTIDGDAGVTNQVLYSTFADAGNTWLSGGSRTGDGVVDKTGLTAGVTYLVCAYSQDATGGRSFSNIKVFTAGPAASTASGSYTKFLADLYVAILNSATLAAAVSGNLADHVKRGRFLHTDAAPLSGILATGPVVYCRYVPYELTPLTREHSQGRFTAELTVVQAFDQSASDDLTAPSNFVEALKQELMSGADGSGVNWSARVFGLRVSVAEPQVIAKDTLATVIRAAVGYTEAI